MPAFVVGTIRITDPAQWQRYVERVASTFDPHEGKVLFRGSPVERLAGTAHGEQIVVIEFPDADAARRWHASGAYQSLIPLRDAAADVVLTLYDGRAPGG